MNNPDQSCYEAYFVQGSVSNFLKLLMPKLPQTYAAVEQLTEAPLEIRRKFLAERAAFLGSRACNTGDDPIALARDDILAAISYPIGREYSPEDKEAKQYAWLAADDTLTDSDMIVQAYPRTTPAIDVELQRMVDDYIKPDEPPISIRRPN